MLEEQTITGGPMCSPVRRPHALTEPWAASPLRWEAAYVTLEMDTRCQSCYLAAGSGVSLLWTANSWAEDRSDLENATDGNLILLGRSREAAAAECAGAASSRRICRSWRYCAFGKQVGSRYKNLRASTNHLFCPSLAYLTDSIGAEVIAAMKLSFAVNTRTMSDAMKAGISRHRWYCRITAVIWG